MELLCGIFFAAAFIGLLLFAYVVTEIVYTALYIYVAPFQKIVDATLRHNYRRNGENNR